MSEFERVIRSDEVVEGRITVGFLGVKRLAFIRLDGVLHAFNNSCPHAASPLSAGLVREGTVVCGRHGWVFDIRSGDCHTNPAYCLRHYAVQETEDGWIEARKPTEIW